MAGGIKGITVKIGGDTTELGRSLSQATTKSTALQKELKGVNTLLKFDPSNVTLLKQKADLLKQSIEQTKNKLHDLVEVQKKVDSGEIEMTEEEYRNLQREIASTEQRLDSLTDQAKEFGSVGAQRVAQVGEKFQKAGATIENVGKKVSALSAVTGAVLSGSVMSASKYEDALAKVGTIADTSKVSMKDLSSEIMDLSNQTGISANEIADATYNAISAGQDTADAVNFVSNATALARAGFTDTASSLDVLSTIMNAYGLEADKVGQVSDMLIQTQNKGKTTVAELASTMGKVIPTANSMNVGLDQLCTGYSIMTARGIATAESTTYMNSMLNELGKSGTKVSEALKSKTGKSFQELMADGHSLGEVLQIVKDYADETGQGFNDLWSSSEAGKAGIVLLSDGVEGFNTALAGMNDSVGATNSALEKMETPSQKARVALNSIKNAGITLGQTALSALSPLIDRVCTSVQNLSMWFTNLSPNVQQVILVIMALVTALGPALVIIGKLIQSVGMIMKIAPTVVSGIKSIGVAIGGISAPVVAIVAVIGTLVGAFTHLWKTNEDFRNKIIEIWNGIVAKFREFGQAIVDRLNALGFDFGSFKDVIKTIWTELCNFLAPIFEGAFQVVSAVLGTVLDTLTGLLDVFIGLFTGNWDQFLTGVSEIFTGIWEGIKGIFSAVLSTLEGAVNVFLGWFGTNWSTVWTNIKTFFSTTWESIKAFFTTTVNAIQTTATNVFTAISNFFTTVWNKIQTTVSTVINTILSTIGSVFNTIYTTIVTVMTNISNTIATVWETINRAVATVVNAIKTVITSVFSAIKALISGDMTAVKTNMSTAWEAIKTAVTTVLNAIKTVITTVFNSIKTVINTVLNGIKSVINTVWNGIKTTITTVLNSIKSVISSVWNGIKSTVSSICNGIKSTVSSIWNSIKSTTSSVWNGIKTGISTAFNSAKSSVTSIANGIKSAVTTAFNGAKSAGISSFNALKSGISTAINGAKSTVSSVVGSIKSIARNIFSGIVPRLKLSLPRVSVSGGQAPFGIMGKGSLPRFHVSWNKLGAIFKKPTIFDTRLGYQGVGEDGPEAIAPISELMKYVTLAVNNGNVADRISRLEEILTTYLPNINRNTQIVLDTGTLVGETIDRIDAGLASNQLLRARGV